MPFRRLDRSAPRIPQAKLHAEPRDVLSTISCLSWREGLSTRPSGASVETTGEQASSSYSYEYNSERVAFGMGSAGPRGNRR